MDKFNARYKKRIRSPHRPSVTGCEFNSVVTRFHAVRGSVGRRFIRRALLALPERVLKKSLGRTNNTQYADIGERARVAANSASPVLSWARRTDTRTPFRVNTIWAKSSP
jgi:hypothetical protein